MNLVQEIWNKKIKSIFKKSVFSQRGKLVI